MFNQPGADLPHRSRPLRRILVIAESSQSNLLRLNTALRRTTLLVRLLAPLLASAIATAFSYRTAALVLLANSVLSAATENAWVAMIWVQFPGLEHDELLRARRRDDQAAAAARAAAGVWQAVGGACSRAKQGVADGVTDWIEFARMPVFMSKHIQPIAGVWSGRLLPPCTNLQVV